MSTTSLELQERIKKAKEEYAQYVKSQEGITLPTATISFEAVGENHTEVHMDTAYKDRKYHFRSVNPDDAEAFQRYLNSQPLVKEKFAKGEIVSVAVTKSRVQTLHDRFNRNLAGDLYLYGGFVVSDAENDTFLGVANAFASGNKDGRAEISFLNRADAWSSATPAIVEEYAIPNELKLKHQYAGLGTVEVCTLLQYSKELKRKGCQIQGKDLIGVKATARLDNPGSWKSCAKAGMAIIDVYPNPEYGPELRYQLRKDFP